MSLFGAIRMAQDLENAVLTTLDKWFKVYLTEYELQASLIDDKYEPLNHSLPKSFMRADQIDRAAADVLPAIVVISPGLRGAPLMEGDGSYRVPFAIAAGVFVGANDRAETMTVCRIYTGIVRSIMLQKQSFGGYADGSTWLDESYNDNFEFTDTQTISAGQVVFEVEVAGVVNRFMGPVGEPSPDQPGSDWPLAETVTAAVTPKED